MKTTKSIKKIERATHTVDAAGQSVGRLATKIAHLLRGKHKAVFTPHVENGDFVVVENISKIVFTGKKLEQKEYKRHSLFPGGLKITRASDLMVKNPGKILEEAVKDMLPPIKARRFIMRRLIIK